MIYKQAVAREGAGIKHKHRLLTVLLAVFLLLGACTQGYPATPTPSAATETALETQAPQSETPPQTAAPTPELSVPPDGTLKVVFFDVGQGDCALVLAGQQAMLIDAGNTGQDELILAFLGEYGVTRLDYFVLTHPHADHIGGASGLIRALEDIGALLMPDVIHTTQTFERLLDAIEERDVPVIVPEPGERFLMGDAAIQVLAPGGGGYGDLNDYSIVLKVTFGRTAFLFTGDAEALSERQQLAAGFDLSADVIKIGHHGSNSSTTQEYLDAVSPRYAVISCGAGNSYGHPHSETLEKLAALGVTVYRTDESGTIVFETDGAELAVR